MNPIHRLLLIFMLITPVMSLPACAAPLTYSAKEIRGQIVDAETSQPVGGTVIVAQWVLYHMGPGHGGHKGRIHIHETVTDKEGRYTIPTWGPKAPLPFTWLTDRDPVLSIFKSGYEPLVLLNARESSESVRVSDWDGKVIKLKKSEGSLEGYASRLESMSIGLPYEGKEWKLFPRMLLALDAENRRLLSLGLNKKYRTSFFEIEYFNESDRNYLRGFENEKSN